VDAPTTPVAATLPLYAVPTVSPDNDAGKMIVGAVMVMLKGPVVAVSP
jgi:hypothetical protein